MTQPERTFRLKVTAEYSKFCGDVGRGRPNERGWWVTLDGYDQEVPFGRDTVIITDCSLRRCPEACEYRGRCVQGRQVGAVH